MGHTGPAVKLGCLVLLDISEGPAVKLVPGAAEFTAKENSYRLPILGLRMSCLQRSAAKARLQSVQLAGRTHADCTAIPPMKMLSISIRSDNTLCVAQE
jgi:hypothetical protein